jgi:hypothetical protein
MKAVVGSANNSRAFNLHFVQINGRIQDNITPFVHKFPKEKKKFTLVAYQYNCVETELSDRTNNVQGIKYFNFQLFVFFPNNKVWEFNKKSKIHTYWD